MAKLNGVTTVSERIQYNGAEYVKSDKAAVVGDIIRFDEDGYSRVTKGGFYVVDRVDNSEDAHITCDEGYDFDTCGDDLTVFKRVKVIAEPAMSEIPAPKTKVKATVGDRIRITEAFGTEGKYTNGDEFVVKSVRHDGRVFVAEHDRPIAQSEYEIVTQPQYREVKRKANVGERIKIVKENNYRGFSVGDEFTVNRVDTDGSNDVRITLNGDSRKLVVFSEYVVLEPVQADDARKAEEPRLKVGEYAKIVTKEGGILGGFAVGEIVQLVENIYGPSDIHYRVAKLADESNTAYAAKNGGLIRATDAEVAEAKRKAARTQFAAGDYVRLTNGGGKWPLLGFENGKIYEVSEPNSCHSSGGIEIKRANGGRGYAKVDQIVKLTPAEAEEARKEAEEAAAKAADEAKWTAIGRKVGEFKAGDVVRVTGGPILPVGTIGTVVDQPSNWFGGKRTAVKSTNRVALSDCTGAVELIAPVESLFNR